MKIRLLVCVCTLIFIAGLPFSSEAAKRKKPVPRLDEENHIVLWPDPKEVCVSISNVDGIFRLNDNQYMNLLKIPLC